MNLKQCIVCSRKVPEGFEQDHLEAHHLGPHVWWYNARQFQTMEPSLTVAQIKRIADNGYSYQFFEERNGKWVYFSDGESVDLTRQPHFFAIPPATMFG